MYKHRILNLQANTGVVLDGSTNRVTEWEDQSDYGNNAVQTDSAKMPILDTSTSNVLLFDGTKQLDIQYAESLNLISPRWSVLMFFKINSITAGDLIKDLDSSGVGYRIRINTAGKLRIVLRDSVGHNAVKNLDFSFTVGRYYLLAFVKDDFALRVYIDNHLIGRLVGKNIVTTNTQGDIHIGKNLIGGISVIQVYTTPILAYYQNILKKEWQGVYF